MAQLDIQIRESMSSNGFSEDGSTDEDEHMLSVTEKGGVDVTFTIVDEDEGCSTANISDGASCEKSMEKPFSGGSGEGPYWVDDVLLEVKEEHISSKLNLFSQFCAKWINDKGLNSTYTFSNLLQASSLFDLSYLKKEKDEFTVLVALWVCFLRVMKMNMTDPPYKYRDVNYFLFAYEGLFDNIDVEEQLKLMDTANWMAIVLPMVVAKKSKGLILHVVPKLLEGFAIKYVTGSGQSKKTSNRVAIFEHEGNVQPCKKRKWSTSKEEPITRAPKLLKSPSKLLHGASSLPPKPPAPVARAPVDGAKSAVDAVKDAFSKQDIEKFRRESFYSGPPLLERGWSEDYSHHFDIEIDQLL